MTRLSEWLMYLCRKNGRCSKATFGHIPTFPPFANIASACALPIPLAAPVIIATLPSTFMSAAGFCAAASLLLLQMLLLLQLKILMLLLSQVLLVLLLRNAKITGLLPLLRLVLLLLLLVLLAR